MSVSTVPSLLYDTTQDDLQSALRRVLDSRSTTAQLLALAHKGSGYDDALWITVARDMGLAGLLIPGQFGGAGASVREVAVVMEELGRALAPIPYLASAVLATAVLTSGLETGGLTASGPGGAALHRLASGEMATLVVPATSGPRSPHAALPGRRANSDQRVALSGTVTGVLAADCAAMLVVPAIVDGAHVVTLVEHSAAGISVTAPTSMDITRPVFDIDFDNTPAEVLIVGTSALQAVEDALRIGAAMLASEQVGVGDWALATAQSYLTVRHQFGRPIGSYQSLRHRAAQLWIDNQQARAAAQYAAAVLATDSSDSRVAVSLAKSYCVTAALTGVEECLQMHGGIGFTWEHPVHFYLKRAFTSTVILGSDEEHYNYLGDLLDLPAT